MLRSGLAPGPLEPLARHYDWLDRDPDPDGDGLIAIIHPDESGLDDSPKYDQVFRWMGHYRPGYFWLVQRHRRLGYSARAMSERFHHHVEDVLVNVLYALSLRALPRMSGEPRFLQRAERAEAALMERCWDERRGLFFDLAMPRGASCEVSTWSSLAPLALRTLPRSAAPAGGGAPLDPRRYRAPVGIPSVSMEEPSFRRGLHPTAAGAGRAG